MMDDESSTAFSTSTFAATAVTPWTFVSSNLSGSEAQKQRSMRSSMSTRYCRTARAFRRTLLPHGVRVSARGSAAQRRTCSDERSLHVARWRELLPRVSEAVAVIQVDPGACHESAHNLASRLRMA